MKLDIIHLDQIHIGHRHRKELGNIDELADSFKTKGFITPLAVAINFESGFSEPFYLLAGGRRCAAARVAGINEVPVRIYERQLTEVELREIELEENIQRKDLEWREKVNLQREIHQLKVQIHGEKHSTLPDATGWSMRDTASLLGKSIGGISMDEAGFGIGPLLDVDTIRSRIEAVLRGDEEAA